MSGHYTRKTVDISEVHSSLDMNIIQISEDRLSLIIERHLKLCEKRSSWVAPLGILITLVAVYLTTDFKEAFSLSADTWRAIFILLTLGSVFWLIKSVFQAYKSLSSEELVKRIKTGSV